MAMTLELHFHPLASFCHKVLVPLYENETPFDPHIVDLADAAARARFLELSPLGKFPVLRDRARDRTIPESSAIIEYLDLHYPGETRFVPEDPELALETRLRDRFFDLNVHQPMQKIVTDTLRPSGKNDPLGVAEAKATLETAYGMIEAELKTGPWAIGDTFTMADCAAAPALFYANTVVPFGAQRPHLTAYLRRLMERPSYARTLDEARPYFANYPMREALREAYGF